MKKFMAILLAGALFLGCSMTAFANSSVGTAEQASITAELTGTTSASVVISQTYNTDEEAAAAAAMAASPEETLTDLLDSGSLDLSDLGDVSLTTEEASDLVFKAVMNVTLDGDTSSLNWPVTVRFSIPGVTSSSQVLVVYYSNGQWLTKAVTLGNGYVDVEFASEDELGAVAFYVDADTVANANSSAGVTTSSSSSSSSSSTTTTSPETGELPLARTLGVVAAVALIGMAVAMRRRYAEA